MLTVEENQRRFELYDMKLSDEEIAKRMFLSVSAIWRWRQKNELPPNYQNGHVVLTGKKTKEIRRLYDSGMNDSDIARIAGVSQPSVFKWRKREGLPANCKKGGWKKNEEGEWYR